MSGNVSQQAKTASRVPSLFVLAFALACAFARATNASAQDVNPYEVPDAIKAPIGNKAFLIAHAFGSQGYTCLPTSNGGTAWSTNARPEATLFVEVFGQMVPAITNFTSINANPKDFVPKPVPLAGNATWQSSFDTSKVWAQKIGGIPAGARAQLARLSCKRTKLTTYFSTRRNKAVSVA